MSDKCQMCLLGLIFSALLTGIRGADVFFRSGEDVSLSCNNALSGCKSTTWLYSRDSEAVELIEFGIKTSDGEKHGRLSLSSDCSLNIKNIRKEDRGLYNCRQFVNNVQETDEHVFLHVLQVSSSLSQSEIRSGSSLTLFCQLYYYRVSCDSLVGSEGLHLVWVDQAGVKLTDSRFQISSSGPCLSVSLTTTLLDEDHDREWSCQLQQGNQPKTSASYTVQYSAPTLSPVSSSTSTTAPTRAGLMDSTLISVSSSNSEQISDQTPAAPTERGTVRESRSSPTPVTVKQTTTKLETTSVIGIVAAAAAAAVLIIAVILWVIRKKRSDKQTTSNLVTASDNRKETNDSVKCDVTYTEVATYCKTQARKDEVHDDDKVTYSSIR